jgi:meso-butanediol dehydrogenase/(S,S)-butanediol dehydrogenase/diacetyl reductase
MALAVVEKLGGLDILINAAGVLFDGDLVNTYPQDFDYLLDINLRCAFHMTMILSKYLRLSQGCIVNISGTWGS